MSKKLDQVRKKIDALDSKIHDTLMERAGLIMDVAAEKRAHNMPFVQPAREAQMIRKLMTRHKGDLPPAAVVRIWRELVGAVSLMQTGLKVNVTTDEKALLWDLAKSYFGSVVPMQRSSSPLAAIASVRENKSSFAVVPWPQDGEAEPWWPYLFKQESADIKIVCALPYGSVKGENLSWEDKGLIISKTDYAESGEDHSFIAMELDQTVSRARIVEALRELSFEPLSVFSQSTPHGAQGTSLHFVELNDFLVQDDKRLEEFTEKFAEFDARCVALGGYPVPPVYDKPAVEDEPKIVAPLSPSIGTSN